MDGRTEPNHLARAKGLIAGGSALLAFVAALAAGTAGAPALGGISWLMVAAGALGVVYVAGAVLVAALAEMRTHTPPLRPVLVSSRDGRSRSTGR
jgi:hypothetical protein